MIGLAAIGTRIGAFFAGLWPKIVFVGALLLALFGVYAAVRRSGRDAERADQLDAGVKTIGRANAAALRVEPTQEAIANDPNNLDRVR